MAKWVEEYVLFLVALVKENPVLAKNILATIRFLENHPVSGDAIGETRRSYTEPNNRFRIGYNYVPGQEIEIVVITLL